MKNIVKNSKSIFYNIFEQAYIKREDRITNIFINILSSANESTINKFIDYIFPDYFSKEKLNFSFNQQTANYFDEIKFSRRPDCGIKWEENKCSKYLIIEIKVGPNSFWDPKNTEQLISNLASIKNYDNAYFLCISDDSEYRIEDFLAKSLFDSFRDQNKRIQNFNWIKWDKIFEFGSKENDDQIFSFLLSELNNYKKQLVEIKMEKFGAEFNEIVNKSFLFQSLQTSGIYETFTKRIEVLFNNVKIILENRLENDEFIGSYIIKIEHLPSQNFPLKSSLKFYNSEYLNRIPFYFQYRRSRNEKEEFIILLRIEFDSLNRILMYDLLKHFKGYLGHYDGKSEFLPFEDQIKNSTFKFIEFKKTLISGDEIKWDDNDLIEQLREKASTEILNWIKTLENIFKKFSLLMENVISEIRLNFNPKYYQFTEDGYYQNRYDRYGLLMCNSENSISFFFGLKVNYSEPFYACLYFFIETHPGQEKIRKEIIDKFNCLNIDLKNNFKQVDGLPKEWPFIIREKSISELIDNESLSQLEFSIQDYKKMKTWFAECLDLINKMDLI